MGNPEFGKKYKEPVKEEIPFDAQVLVRLHKKTKTKLQELAAKKGDKCAPTDLVRKAIYKLLEEEEGKITA